MPEPLKNLYSQEVVSSIARHCNAATPNFDQNRFIDRVLQNDWQELELKDRMHRLAEMLGKFLSKNYPKAIDAVLQVEKNYSGLVHMCFPDFVEIFGLAEADFDLSMAALEIMTERSSSEFAIRPFILRYPEKTMKKMLAWSKSNNYHVRRLATEGCRPRLPWAMALPEYKKDPSVVLKTIMHLIDDDELYVRRSVANNLNDISKDNAKEVISIVSKYFSRPPSDRSKEVDWVIKHACRGLLKQGNKEVLRLFGYANPNHISVNKFISDRSVKLGEHLNFSFNLQTVKKSLGNLRVEFIIEFMKANGKTAGKIFKVCEGNYYESEKAILKYFSFKKISTRKYYLGEHQITIVVNGENFESLKFKLI